MELTTKVYFSIGSNVGDRLHHLQTAVDRISETIGEILAVSKVYESDPVGFSSAEKFLNACILTETELSPHETLSVLNTIEKQAGRKRRDDGTYTDRTLDIDIIFYGQKVLATDDLKIPHPRFKERLFVLMPLNDIDSHLLDPLSGVAISQLLKSCEDTCRISPTDLRLFI